MEMKPLIVYYGYTYFGLPDIEEKKRGCVYSYGTLDDSDRRHLGQQPVAIGTAKQSHSQFQDPVPGAIGTAEQSHSQRLGAASSRTQ